MPATVEALMVHLGIVTARPVDTEALGMAVDAANDMVAAYRSDLTVVPAHGVPITQGYWRSNNVLGMTEPPDGKYRVDANASPTAFAVAGIDDDGLDRMAGLLSMGTGDVVRRLSPLSSVNWSVFTLDAGPIDHATWVEVAVTLTASGPGYVPPGGNDRVLFEAWNAAELPPIWPIRADEAAVIQAARLYGRRGSVVGVAAYQDIGVSLLPRLDPDVRALLQLGEYQDSVVS